MKPYRATQAPPMTHLGIELMSATNGVRKERSMHPKPAVAMEMTEALPVMATQPMDSP